MKKFCLAILALLLFANTIMAASGDTIRVQVHRNVDMPWYGNYDAQARFPAPGSYRQILMHYTMGCPNSGCSDWDYTTQIFFMKPTGVIDTAISYAPRYVLNGNAITTLSAAFDTTYTTYYDSIARITDSIVNPARLLRVYADSTQPYVQTDSQWVWNAAYFNYYFDTLGNRIDSIQINADQTYVQYLTTIRTPFEVLEPFELGRVITPYGGNLPSTWTRKFTFDVTDFAPLLHDSALLRAFCSCWSNGWRASTEFEFIEGTPDRRVTRVENLYNRSFSYGTPGYEANLPARKFKLQSNEKHVKLHFTPTGHGFGGSAENCAEFCDRTFYVNVNNVLLYSESIWRDDCGLNPVYPQAGTWLVDRANWCPGAKGLSKDFELGSSLTPGDSFEVNVDLDPFVYTGPGDKTPSYTVGSALFFYEDVQFDRDAAIVDVIRPSGHDDYSRFNPVCAGAKITIANKGKEAITAAIIKYGIKGEAQFTKYWNGYLGYNQTEVLDLPGVLLPTASHQEFEAFIYAPNGLQDQNTGNDTLRSLAAIPAAYDSVFLVVVKPNNDYTENSWVLKNELGNVVYERPSFSSNALVRDTVRLQPGCYEFEFFDTGKDGLYFAFNVATSGSGYVRFQRFNGTYIYNFKNDFGTKLQQSFTVGTPEVIVPTSVQAPVQEPQIEVYPNPTQNRLMVDVSLGYSSPVTLRLMELSGRLLYQAESKLEGMGLLEVPVTNLMNGMYLLDVQIGDRVWKRKVMVQH